MGETCKMERGMQARLSPVRLHVTTGRLPHMEAAEWPQKHRREHRRLGRNGDESESRRSLRRPVHLRTAEQMLVLVLMGRHQVSCGALAPETVSSPACQRFLASRQPSSLQHPIVVSRLRPAARRDETHRRGPAGP